MARFLFLKLPLFLIIAALVLFVLGTPVIGFWLASSLAAYLNGPIWMALLAGILICPLLPLTWDVYGIYRRKKKNVQKPRWFKFGYRLVFKTLALSIVLISCLLVWMPKTAFVALSTRGDWMLETGLIQNHLSQPLIGNVRKSMFSVANRLEWLYVVLNKNPYENMVAADDSDKINPIPQIPETENRAKYNGWPWKDNALHPAVASMPSSVETSIESVAHYLAQKESDPFLRIKAIHDYVADRVSYDTNALQTGVYPPQDAKTVFTTHKSVCAGYANMFQALGKAINEEIVIVSGFSRNQGSDISGRGHAWNAVKIQDNWYLVDTTWDSGYVNGNVFTKEYTTDYLFPPPQIIAVTHFPKDPEWQLLSQPLTRGEFIRQPWLKPAFFANGFRLVSPTRSQSDVENKAVLQIINPQKRWVIAKFNSKGADAKTKCDITGHTSLCITCSLPDEGTYEVSLFSSAKQYGSYGFIGRVEFNNRL